jgi:hypothetical protein
MDEKKRKWLVYASLVGAIIFALIMRPWEGRKRKPPETVTLTAGAETMAQPLEIKASETNSTQATDSALPTLATGWPRDPFGETPEPARMAIASTGGTSTELFSWNLQGIMTVDGQPVCLLNGQTLKIGSFINGWELAHIADDGVRLRRGAQTQSVALP